MTTYISAKAVTSVLAEFLDSLPGGVLDDIKSQIEDLPIAHDATFIEVERRSLAEAFELPDDTEWDQLIRRAHDLEQVAQASFTLRVALMDALGHGDWITPPTRDVVKLARTTRELLDAEREVSASLRDLELRIQDAVGRTDLEGERLAAHVRSTRLELATLKKQLHHFNITNLVDQLTELRRREAEYLDASRHLDDVGVPRLAGTLDDRIRYYAAARDDGEALRARVRALEAELARTNAGIVKALAHLAPKKTSGVQS